MTAIEDHCDTIRSWLNFEYDSVLITSWTRMAEELLSTDLRCKHMINIYTGSLTENRVALPPDWQELDFVRLVGGKPLKFRNRNDFYDNPNNDPNHSEGYYTITGNFLDVGGNIDGTKDVELAYFKAIPPLGDSVNWLMQYYSRLYVSSTIAVSKMYSIDDEDKAVVWDAATQDFINKINDEYRISKSSGSRINAPRKKGFG